VIHLPARQLSVIVATLLSWVAPAQALTVAIVRPPGSAPDAAELVVRLRGELLSVGLEVATADRPAGDGTTVGRRPAWLEHLVAARAIDAVIDILPGEGAPATVDVWIVGKPPRTFEVAKVAVPPHTENATEQLAIRAIEVLRSSFTELDWAARDRPGHPAAAPPPSPSHLAVEAAAPTSSARLGIAAGGAAATGLDGAGTALLPVVRVDVAAWPWFSLQATLAGFGTRSTVAAPAGSALLGQGYGVAGGCLRLAPDHRLRPFVALAAGALRTSIAGQAEAPMQAHAMVKWSLLVDGSLGIELRFAGRYALTVAAHVQVAEPYVAIHIADRTAATLGRPNLLMSLTLGAWL
jgi:hypothetical protein